MKRVYICSDTVTGIFSGIYDAWKEKDAREEKAVGKDVWKGKDEAEVCGIAIAGKVEQELFCEYVEVEEDGHKAEAVEKLIRRHLGAQAYWDIYHAVLSEDPDKGDAILGTMLAARKIPDSTKIMEHLSHPQVEKVFELSRKVGGEAHNLKGFVRFRELANGVLYSRVTPKAQVLTCLAPHFADRLPQENWMIHDAVHGMYVVHEAGKQWVLVWDDRGDLIEGDPIGVGRVSEKEREYAGLWKVFCDTIAIESRKNARCQLQHLPLRYRPNMVEFS